MSKGGSRELGEVLFEGATERSADMIGSAGEGWALAMTVVSHEREPGELGYVSRYSTAVNDLVERIREDPISYTGEQLRTICWTIIWSEMLRLHSCRRMSYGIVSLLHRPEGTLDKLLMMSACKTRGGA